MREQAIWKFHLPIEDEVKLLMPSGASILKVGVQAGHAVIWALITPGAQGTWRTFEVYGTGHPCARSKSEYIGTFQLDLPGGEFVGHVFETEAA